MAETPERDAWRAQFGAEVFPAEMAAVRDRRRARDALLAGSAPTTEPSLIDPAVRPTTRHGLVGLALSGGGMRSAAFNLGVLQALRRARILDAVDYLSTVSGGGWIGAALESLMSAPGGPFPFDERPTARGENPVLAYLRGRSNALLPSGVQGGIFLAASMIRGQLATVALLLPLALLLAVLAAPLVLAYLRASDAPDLRHLPWTFFTRHSAPVLGAALAWMLFGFLVNLVGRPGARVRFLLERSNSLMLGLALGAFALELQPYAVIRWSRLVLGDGDDAPSLWSYSPQLMLALLSVLSFGPIAAALPRVARPVGLAAAFAVSVGVPYLVFVHLVAMLIHRALLAHTASPPMNDVLVPVALAAVWLVGSFNTNDVSLHGLFRDRIARTFILARGADGAVAPADELSLSALNRPGSTAPYALINASLNLQASTDRARPGRQGDFFTFSARYVGSDRTGYCPTPALEAVVPGMTLATAVAVSAAAASPHMGTYTVRALVLLMTFLNLRLGFWLPHPGRLRKWLPADWATRSAQWRSLAVWRWYPAVRYFFRELLSRIDAGGAHVYLTDGGHLENTGAYELLRRRCKVIVASDAEEDRFVRFGGLAALVRYARLDLHTRVDLDLGDLRRGDGDLSRRHAALGTITYPALDDGTPEELGYFLYLKSSVTGDEDELIREYRARFGDFPHQSTANQLFDEDQFEAYRALGAHVVEALFPRDFVVDPRSDAAGWLDDLAVRLSPDVSTEPSFAEMRDELEEVETMLREPGVGAYFAELYPELAAGGPVLAVEPERLFAIATRQIHLMATVFNHLGLDVPDAHRLARHQGWMNVFRRWCEAPTFRRHWLVVVHTAGDGFRQFCEAALGLRIEVAWRPVDAGALAAVGPWAEALRDGAPEGARYFVGAIGVRDHAGPTVFAARVVGGAVDVGVTRAGYDGTLAQRARAALEGALAGG